jgi:hypothetical protein
MVQAPNIPRRFMSDHNIDPEIMDCNTTGEEPQFSEHILNAMCDLSDRLYLATTGDINNEPGVKTRLLQEMRQWRRNTSFPQSAQASDTPEMCCLR